MSTLGWILVGAGVLLLIFAGVLAWALCIAAGVTDEMQQMRRLAELGPPVYRPVSDRHIRNFTETE